MAGYHHQWAGPTAVPDAHYPSHNSSDEVRTIFVFGFPGDVKERELQNLLRWWPGYEASQINFKGDQALGFALFSTPHFAMQARDALQNLVFDAESNSILRAEMAKKNLFVKRGVTVLAQDTNSFDHSKRMRTGGDYNPAAYPAPGAFVPQPAPVWGPQGYMAPPNAQYDLYGGYPHLQSVSMPVAPAGYAPVQTTGFQTNESVASGRSTVCFIEFEDINSAVLVHNNLQGAVITSSDRGGMRIQYSKNPYGRKKDGSGPPHAAGGASGMAVPLFNGVHSTASQ